MIKAIIFDIGGVVINLKPWFKKFAQIFKPKNVEKFWKDFNIEAIPLCKNQIPEILFINRLAVSCGVPINKIPKDILVKNFEHTISVNKDLIKIIKKLKGKYKLALLSNIIDSHSKIVKEKINHSYFDAVIFSNEVGLTKDKKEIFYLVAKKLNVKPEECVFVDDIDQFVKVAKSVGMKAILFKNNKQLKSDLKKLLK